MAAVPVATPNPGKRASPKAPLMPEKSIVSLPPPIAASTSTMPAHPCTPPFGLAPLTLISPASLQMTVARSERSDPWI